MRPFAPTAALAAVGAAYGQDAFPTASGTASVPHTMPSCWSQCFSQFNVSGTPEMLCSPKISGFVDQCITVSCNAAGDPAAATQYTSWLHVFCGGHNPFPTGSGYIPPPSPPPSSAVPAPTSSEPVSEPISEPVSEPVSEPISEAPSSSAPIGGHPPVPVFTGTGGHIPFPPMGTGTPSHPPMPECWQTCFTESNITYPEALCFEHPGVEVSQCIQGTCLGSNETNAYYQWVQSFCTPATSSAPPASTSSYAAPTSSSMPASSSIPAISGSIPAWPGTGHPPVGTGSPAPPTFPPMPECWSSCFAAFNVSNPKSLCSAYPGSAVSTCIKEGCEANSTQAYFGWVQSFCLASTGSETPAPSTSYVPEHTSSSPAISSSVPYISGSAPLPQGTGSPSHPPFPGGTGTPSHPQFPDCWAGCFNTYNISSSQSLCSQHPGNMVHSCISASCPVNETMAYDRWVQTACHVGTGTEAVPSSSLMPANSSIPMESSSVPASSVPVVPTGEEHPHPTGGFPQPTGGVSYPPCWGQCFAQNHVYSPGALCAPPVSEQVSDCIAQSCNVNDTARYEFWQHSFCNHTIVPTGSGDSHVPSTSSTPVSSSAPYETPSSSAPVVPTGSSFPPPQGTGYPPPQGTGQPHPPPTNFTMPQCWNACFQAYHVSNPESLCGPSTGKAVGSCISTMCDGTDAAQYDGWKNQFCNSTVPSHSSSSYPVGPTEPASTSSASSTVPEVPATSSSVPYGTGSYPQPTGGAHPPGGNNTHPDMPQCWSFCFAQMNVSNPQALCSPSFGPQVENCISVACNSTESGKFEGWLNDFCRKPVPSGSVPLSSSSYSLSMSSSIVSASATHSASVSASPSVPLGTGSYPPFPPSGTGVPSHPDLPACWSACFAQNHVTSPASLCHPPMGPIVDGCVASTCKNGTDAVAYDGWLKGYCNSTVPIPSGSAHPSPSSHSPSTSSDVPSGSSYPAGPVSSLSTTPVGTGHPYPPVGTGSPIPPGVDVCWSMCFSQSHVTSPSSLCHPPVGPMIDSCITASCNGTSAAKYEGWVNSFCSNSTAPISTGASSSSVVPSSSSHEIPSTSAVHSSVPVSPTGTAPHFPPSGTGAPQSPGGNLPACWGACFAQNHVVAKGALCLQPTKDAVSGCIAQSCAANETVQYSSWLNSFCPAGTAPLGTGSSSSVKTPISTGVSHSMSVSSTLPSSSVVPPVSSSIPVQPTNGTHIPPTNGTQIPQCWTTCFQEHNVPSKDALCDPELTAYVAACIEGSCEAGSSDKYAHWVGEYCDAPSPPSHSSAPVIEPSAIPSSTPSAPEYHEPTSSSAPVVIVDPKPTTSSAEPTHDEPSSTPEEPTGPPTGHPQGPPTGHPQGPPTDLPHGPPTGQPTGRPTWWPPVYGSPPANTYTNKPPTTAHTPTAPPVVEQPTLTSSSTDDEPASDPATPVQPTTTTEPPHTVTIPSTPETITQHPSPTTLTTLSKPKTTTQGGPPAGYPAGGNAGWGKAPWGTGPPPWLQGGNGNAHGGAQLPPPAVFQNFIDKMRGWIGSVRG